MTHADGPYSQGVYIGIPVTVLLLLLCLAAAVLFWLSRRQFGDDWHLWTGGALATALIVAGCFGVAWWPWDMDYHRWHEKRGTIELAEQRLLGSGDGLNQVFVVKFAGDETLYRCDDTRCALAKPGKEIRLLCKPVNEYAAVDGWRCKYGQAS